MFRFVVLALTVSYVYGYGSPVGLALNKGNIALDSGLGLSTGLGLNSGLALNKGLALDGGLAFNGGLALGTGLALGKGYGGARAAVLTGPITAAIQSTRSYEVVPVALNYEAPVPQTIDVPPNVQPLAMIWRTQSSPLNLEQVHTPTGGQHESTRSEDAPSIVTHESYKPIIQEFREVIQPHRKIEQRIEPVIEHVHTVVAKGEEYRAAPVAFAAKAALPLAAPVLAKGDY